MRPRRPKKELRIDFRFWATCTLDDETGIYVARCPAIEVASQGGTEEEAQEALKSALHMYLTHAYRRGVLHEILDHFGFEPLGDDHGDGDSDDSIDTLTISEVPGSYIDIPLVLASQKSHGKTTDSGSIAC